MQKLLNGSVLADYIQERQGRQARALIQAEGITPKLAIVLTVDNPVIETYIGLKQRYGAEIGVSVELHRVEQSQASATIKKLNKDDSVHAIIVQLPLQDPSQTEEIVNQVSPSKDVDGLGKDPLFDPATPMAIMWLLAGYNVDLKNKQILLVGRGKLVGAPLEKMFKTSGLNVMVVTREEGDLKKAAPEADVIITATGSPAILYSEIIKPGAVLVDAGVASEAGKTVGDLAPSVYERDDITVTPVKGGVGPLTVCALFDNVLRAARPTPKTSAQ